MRQTPTQNPHLRFVKHELERTATANRTRQFNLSAQGLDSVFDDCQAQSGAAHVTRSRFVDPIKPFEHAALMFRGDSDSVIGDGNNCVRIYVGCGYSYPTAQSRVPDGIAHQIVQDGADGFAIGNRHDRLVTVDDAQTDFASKCFFSKTLNALRGSLIEIDSAQFKSSAARFDPRAAP